MNPAARRTRAPAGPRGGPARTRTKRARKFPSNRPRLPSVGSSSKLDRAVAQARGPRGCPDAPRLALGVDARVAGGRSRSRRPSTRPARCTCPSGCTRAHRAQEAALRPRARRRVARAEEHEGTAHAEAGAGTARPAARSSGPHRSRPERAGVADAADLTIWRELDALRHVARGDCRRLHARYIARAATPRSHICDRLAAQAAPTRRRADEASQRAAAPGRSMPALRAVPDSSRRRRRARRRVARRRQAAADRGRHLAPAKGGARARAARRGVRRRAHQPAGARAADGRYRRRTFEPRPPIVDIESLAPGGAYQAVLADLEKHARRTRIALVGHEPGIGELAARLIGSRHPIEFKKGAVCRIDVEAMPPAGPGALRWFLTPKILRSLRK